MHFAHSESLTRMTLDKDSHIAGDPERAKERNPQPRKALFVGWRPIKLSDGGERITRPL